VRSLLGCQPRLGPSRLSHRPELEVGLGVWGVWVWVGCFLIAARKAFLNAISSGNCSPAATTACCRSAVPELPSPGQTDTREQPEGWVGALLEWNAGERRAPAAPVRNTPLLVPQIQGKGFTNKRVEAAPFSDRGLTRFSSMAGCKAGPSPPHSPNLWHWWPQVLDFAGSLWPAASVLWQAERRFSGNVISGRDTRKVRMWLLCTELLLFPAFLDP